MAIRQWLLLCAVWLLCSGLVLPQVEHVRIAKSYAGQVRETGQNRGPKINEWQKRLRVGHVPWCAVFVSFVLDSAKVTRPAVRSAVARKFITERSISAASVLRGRPVPNGALAVWRYGNSWKGHIGIVLSWRGESGITIEGNTSPGTKGAQRDGDGVYIRKRSIQPANYFRITSFTPVSYEV